jgi:RNA polymerase sigma-70 factor (ECF subfamily)
LREAFVLFELEELSAPEVARLLGVSVGTVASRVRLAREQIRKTLGDLGRP